MWMNGYTQNEQQQFGFLDIITIYSAILQTMDYAATMEQSSNDDILRELKRDMMELREQNEKILCKLENIINK